MHLIKYTFLIIQFFLVNLIFANQNIDSLIHLADRCDSDSHKIHLYIEITNAYLKQDPVLAGSYANELSKLLLLSQSDNSLPKNYSRELIETNILELPYTEMQEFSTLSKQKIKNQRFIILLSVTAFTLLSITSFAMFKYMKEQQKHNNELKDGYKQLARKNTALLRREKELKEVVTSKNKLFSIIAHDIKNPLYAMLRLGDIMADKYDLHSDEQRKQYLKHLNQAGKEIVTLTENLLSWSRYQLGSIKFNPVNFPIAEAVNFAMGIFRHMADLKEIKLTLQVHPTHMVYADFSMTMIVIRNITNNAIKFTPRGGEVKIISTDIDTHIKLEVIDNGVGIPSDKVENLFQIERGTTQPGTEGEKGSGLGLTICKEFVSRNKGKTGVKSKINKGSNFWFTVPKIKN
jgi:signal transduction histidine kinase